MPWRESIATLPRCDDEEHPEYEEASRDSVSCSRYRFISRDIGREETNQVFWRVRIARYNGLDLYGAFQGTQSALTGFQVPFIHSHTIIPMVVNYDSSHSCPGADWRNPGCHSAPTAPPTTTSNIQQSDTFTRGKVGEVSRRQSSKHWPTRSTTWATVASICQLYDRYMPALSQPNRERYQQNTLLHWWERTVEIHNRFNQFGVAADGLLWQRRPHWKMFTICRCVCGDRKMILSRLESVLLLKAVNLMEYQLQRSRHSDNCN